MPYTFLRAWQVGGVATGVCRCLFLRFPVLCTGTAVHTFSLTDSVFGTCFAKTMFPSTRCPSLHLLRQPWRTMVFVRRLLRYYGTVRLPGSCIAVVLHRIHGTSHYAICSGQSQDIPVLPCEKLACVLRVLDHAGLNTSRGYEVYHVAFRFPRCVGTPEEGLFAAQYLAHMSPVNVSHPTLRTSAHVSGPIRFATPSSYGTFTHYLTPVLAGAPRADPF